MPSFQTPTPPAAANNQVGQDPGTFTIRTPDGEVLQAVRWIEGQLYGAGELKNGQTVDTLVFSQALSQTIPGSSTNRSMAEVDTNLPKAGSNGLPAAWEMRVFSIAFTWTRAFVTSGSEALSDTSEAVSYDTAFGVDRVLYVEYKYLRREYAWGTPMDFPAGKGFVQGSTLNNQAFSQNGVPSPRDRVSYVIPIRETAGNAFQCKLHPCVSLTISQVARLTANTTFNGMDVKIGKYGFIQMDVG